MQASDFGIVNTKVTFLRENCFFLFSFNKDLELSFKCENCYVFWIFEDRFSFQMKIEIILLLLTNFEFSRHL